MRDSLKQTINPEKQKQPISIIPFPIDVMNPVLKFLPLILFVLFYLNIPVNGQLSVAISIDDIPNTGKSVKENYNSKFLLKLDSLNLPVMLFVNEGLVHKGDNPARNLDLLNRWFSRKYTTVGYHSSKHSRYSEAGLDSFEIDVEQGEAIVREIAAKYGKSIDYFRLPYNDLGKDSLQHVNIKKYLDSRKFKIAPFTVESSDWMFNYIYEYYLERKDSASARDIADKYIQKTLEYFAFFDTLSRKIYGRSISQIYLCHDNALNADYIPVLINALKKGKYKFISFQEAVKDKVYKQKDNYYKKWGISWFYRWMKNQAEIAYFSKGEPADDSYGLYKKLVEEQKK